MFSNSSQQSQAVSAAAPAAAAAVESQRSAPRSRDDVVDLTADAWDVPLASTRNTRRQDSPSAAPAARLQTNRIRSATFGSNRDLTQSRRGNASDTAVKYDQNGQPELASSGASRLCKIKATLSTKPEIDLAALRKAAWPGIPQPARAQCWRVLVDYAPCNLAAQADFLLQKRNEYRTLATDFAALAADALSSPDRANASNINTPSSAPASTLPSCLSPDQTRQQRTMIHQIHIDVLRTIPTGAYKNPELQMRLKRVLFCWATNHPACGYVQGINDLLTPFFSVFLCEHLAPDANSTNFLDAINDEKCISTLSPKTLDDIEADSYWCLTRFIEGIQDNYTHAQPGIHKQVAKLRDLVYRIDATLAEHFASENIEFMHFSFRWMNCLLMREVTHAVTIRMWDTYMAEGGALMDFHVYVCVAFLLTWSKKLVEMQFADILLFLQNPPTKVWGQKEIEDLLSRAFVYKELYHNSPKHYASNSPAPSSANCLGEKTTGLPSTPDSRRAL